MHFLTREHFFRHKHLCSANSSHQKNRNESATDQEINQESLGINTGNTRNVYSAHLTVTIEIEYEYEFFISVPKGLGLTNLHER